MFKNRDDGIIIFISFSVNQSLLDSNNVQDFYELKV